MRHSFLNTALDSPARLDALERTELLDSLPEPAFDRLVALGSRLMGTPVNLVSLVDDRRQFFKAQCGLPAPYDTERQTPLTHSFCQHVVTSDAPLVVTDSRRDARVAGNGAIEDLSVIAYLGVPIRAPGGEVLGSFCAIQSEPRDWTDDELRLLADLAASVESEIALRLEVGAREAERRTYERILDELPLGLSVARRADGTHRFSNAIARRLYPANGLIGPDHPLHGPLADDAARAGEARLHPPGAEAGHPDTRHLEIDSVFVEAREPLAVALMRDVTERRRMEAARERLTAELDHRVKNLFAIISGMVGATARSAPDTAAMAQALRGRIRALAQAHALVRPALTPGTPGGAREDNGTLHDVARAILAPHIAEADADAAISGPEVALSPEAASQISLVLHELATNAAKYGALSRDGGALRVDWTEDGDTLDLVWTETHPDLALEPEPGRAAGLGSRLIEGTVRGWFGGRLEQDWRADGLTCRMALRRDRVS